MINDRNINFISKRDRGAMIRRQTKKYPPVMEIEEYVAGKHVTRHNTICYNIDEAYAIEIYEKEKKLILDIHHGEPSWLAQFSYLEHEDRFSVSDNSLGDNDNKMRLH